MCVSEKIEVMFKPSSTQRKEMSHISEVEEYREPRFQRAEKANLHVPRIVERCLALFIIDDWNDEVHEVGERKGVSHKQEVGKWGGGVTASPVTSTEDLEYH